MRHLALVLVLVLANPGCRRGKSTGAGDAGQPIEQPATAPSPADADDPEVKPVFADVEGPALAEAERFCRSIHGLPLEKRATCCHAPKPSPSISERECVRTLSASVRSGGVRIDSARMSKCLEEQSIAVSSCGFVGQWLLALPPDCADLLIGQRKTGDVCRSSLECAEGETCLGVGPTSAGRCGPARPDGQACLTAVDPLASFTRQETDVRHRECAGYCGHRRCMPIAAPGAPCRLARECPNNQHCNGRQCVEGHFAKSGEACVADACASGLRCVSGTCAVPHEEGAACSSDYECLGGCLPATHRCGMRCDVY